MCKPHKHVKVECNKPDCPERHRCKQAYCVLCCRLCTNGDGSLKSRNDYHKGATFERGTQRVEIGKGRDGHKTRFLCATCGYVPLCTAVRFPGPNAVSCWEAWHKEKDLMSGALSMTYCHMKCPEDDLDVAGVTTLDTASARPTPSRNKGNINNLAGCSRGRKRKSTMAVVSLPHRSGRRNSRTGARSTPTRAEIGVAV